jgi:hypothetical protein
MEKEFVNYELSLRMKAKLIKTGNDYLIRNMNGEVLAITNGTTEGRKLSKQNCDEIFGVCEQEAEKQQITEIEVEIEIREDYLMWKHSDIEKMSDCLVPKLDSEGCLILTKKI